MNKIVPKTPKGVRDFLPEEYKQRQGIINTIKSTFELFGFDEIYTPAFENLDTLTEKYGEEGDKLLFKILNSGNYISEEVKKRIQADHTSTSQITKLISKKGLRYDLTIPLARFVSQHQNELIFPFKRYQIAPVWRADRPQKGRYQEFFQCDVDIVGKNGIVADIEIVNLVLTVFKKLNLEVQVSINNRKIFNGICQDLGIEDKAIAVSVILDKWTKIGEEKVKNELNELLGEEKAQQVFNVFSNNSMDELNQENELIQEGLSELNQIMDSVNDASLVFDIKLLRGLDYYTGTVLEAFSTEVSYGSLLGGGRYANLTEMFGLKNMSGIGVAFGLDRIYDVIYELNKFSNSESPKKILAIYMDLVPINYNLQIAQAFRSLDIAMDLYPQKLKMDKQLSYADKKGYSHAIIIGEEEVNKNQFLLKNLKTKLQIEHNFESFINNPTKEIL